MLPSLLFPRIGIRELLGLQSFGQIAGIRRRDADKMVSERRFYPTFALMSSF